MPEKSLDDEFMPNIKRFCSSINQELSNHPAVQYAVDRRIPMRQLLKIMYDYHPIYPVIVGKPHAGKTDFIKGLARKIDIGDVPDVFLNSELFTVHWTKLAHDKHEYSDFKKLLKECVDFAALHSLTEWNVIVIMDEHVFRNQRLLQILKPFLHEGLIQIIFKLTTKEYDHYVKPDRALQKRLHVVVIKPLVMEYMCRAILVNVPAFQLKYHVKIDNTALDAVLNYCIDDDVWMTSHTYKAFQLLKASCRYAKKFHHSVCTGAVVKHVLSQSKK